MSPVKRAWIILLAILIVELIPFTLTFVMSPPGAVRRLYGFDPSHGIAWLAALVIAVVYIGYAVRAFPIVREQFLTFNSMKVVAILFAIVTGTVEELYFRKFLMDWAAQRDLVVILQVAVSALAFGAVHGVWGMFAKQWQMALGATAATGILGALLALVYLAAGRQVAPCVWSHMAINLAIEPWLILAAASNAIRSSDLGES